MPVSWARFISAGRWGSLEVFSNILQLCTSCYHKPGIFAYSSGQLLASLTILYPLTIFQALIAMVCHLLTYNHQHRVMDSNFFKTIFAMNTCSLQIENFLIGEASRTVLALRYHKSILIDANAAACYRAFWVVYHMEKQYSFQARSSSVCYFPTLKNHNRK